MDQFHFNFFYMQKVMADFGFPITFMPKSVKGLRKKSVISNNLIIEL